MTINKNGIRADQRIVKIKTQLKSPKQVQFPWYSRQLERLTNMPVVDSSLQWTVPPVARIDYPAAYGNGFSLEILYRPARPRVGLNAK